ncbi:hypothetical protein JCM30760_25270 [Thiomicrorhabdus hydrogeniphila]
MLKKLSVVFISSAFFLASGYASAHPVNGNHHHQKAPSTQVTFLFSNNDRHYVNQHHHKTRVYNKHRKGERRLKRGYVMPKQMHYTRLPANLERRLRPLPNDYIRIRIGNEIGIMNIRTRIIYDSMWFIN